MINRQIADMMLEKRGHFMIPGDVVASVGVDNTLRHAFLVLTKIGYAKVPVLDNEGHFKGLLSLSMITDKMLGLQEVSLTPLDDCCVKDVMQTNVPTIKDPYDIEEVLHLLVDQPFLPVVSDTGLFTGIVTRREVMKGINHIAHTLDDRYEIIAK